MNSGPRGIRLLNLCCKDATRLSSERLDRSLNGLERVGLTIHLCICGPCRRFTRQLMVLRQLMRRLMSRAGDESIGLSETARRRIRNRIERNSTS